MIDFGNIENYKENNRIEAKKSLGGFPKSLWETYSAFANTLGGVILLGVEEHRDKSFHAHDLPDPKGLINEFWSIVNNPNKVSANILSKNDVTIEAYQGKHIVAIRVPRAQRSDKPVYIDGNPITGTYRRNGEGDYRCSESEIKAMLRDAERKTHDMRVIENMNIGSLDKKSIRRYRSRLKSKAVKNKLGDTELLYKIGAIDIIDGEYRPTFAGLLMFGREEEISKKYPEYFLEYRGKRASDMIISDSGTWSGNVFDFYFAVCEKINKKIKSEDMKNALCEALVNCLANADYYGENGIVVENGDKEIVFSNPGRFRVDLDFAKLGGVSDPRNAGVTKIFKYLDIGEGSGSGIPNIFKVWRDKELPSPVIFESFAPDRITFVLPLSKEGANICSPYSNEMAVMRSVKVNLIIEYLTERISATEKEIAQYIELKASNVRPYLDEMVKNGIIVYEGKGRSKIYRLKG